LEGQTIANDTQTWTDYLVHNVGLRGKKNETKRKSKILYIIERKQNTGSYIKQDAGKTQRHMQPKDRNERLTFKASWLLTFMISLNPLAAGSRYCNNHIQHREAATRRALGQARKQRER
jgi:hypothetical protein